MLTLYASCFQGQRLGTTSEQSNLVPPSRAAIQRDENIPEPILDPNLTDEQREEARKARLAAVEARLKKQGGPPKKKPTNNAPLKGPNSEPLMRWN